MRSHAFVISLRRTPERLSWFLDTNKSAHDHFHWVAGIDGQEIQECLHNSRLVSRQALREWTPGAIGSALSHFFCWRQCLLLNEPVLVFEDDAILSPDWREQVQCLSQQKIDWDFILLGWNYNSILQSRSEDGIETIRLFEPPFPNNEQIRKIFTTIRERHLERLIRSFGFPGYLISPKGARRLLAELPPLNSCPLSMKRGIPETMPFTLDGMLNHFHSKINSWAINPPLAISLNDPTTSLTLASPTIQNFGRQHQAH